MEVVWVEMNSTRAEIHQSNLQVFLALMMNFKAGLDEL